LPMSETKTPAPEEIAALAGRCVTHVRNRTGIEPDFQSETLSVVDFFIKDMLREEGGGAVPEVGDHRRSEMMHLFAPSIGAYFGELVRRMFSCRWRMDSADPMEWTIEFDYVPLTFNPVGAAAEALVEMDGRGGGCRLRTRSDETEALLERLEAAPPVLESDFFSLTTRLEVLQIAVDWLRGRVHNGARDSSRPKFYSKDDYDELF
jgi:hypothetical protein